MIPQHLIESIQRHVQHGIPCGSFMDSVLCNDLTEACSRADKENQYLIFDIVKYLYNNVPSECWGSPNRVKTWRVARSNLATLNIGDAVVYRSHAPSSKDVEGVVTSKTDGYIFVCFDGTGQGQACNPEDLTLIKS